MCERCPSRTSTTQPYNITSISGVQLICYKKIAAANSYSHNVAVEIRMYGRQNLKFPTPRDKTEQTHGKTTKQNTKRKPYNITEIKYNKTIWHETTNHRSKTTLSHYSNHHHLCNNQSLARHQRTHPDRTLSFSLQKFNLLTRGHANLQKDSNYAAQKEQQQTSVTRT